MAAPDFSAFGSTASLSAPPPDTGTKPPDFSQFGITPPVQMQGNWRTPAMIGSNVVKGLAGTAGLPGDVLQSQGFSNPILNIPEMALSGATRWVLDQLGIPQDKVPIVPGEPPTGAQFQVPLKQAGIVDRPDLQAQNEGEKVIQAASQGVGASLPFAGMGGPVAALRTLISGAAGGAGAYEGGKYGGEPGSRGSEAGQLIGGILGGGGTDVALGTLGKVGGAALSRPSPMLDPYTRLDIKPRMVGDVTGSPTAQFIQSFGAKMPGGIGTTEAAAKSTLGEFNDAVHRTADQFGPQKTAEDAGQTLQNSVHNWIENVLPARRNQAWAPVNQLIPFDTPTSIANYRARLEALTSKTPGMEASGQRLAPAAASELMSDLNKDVPPGGTVPWATAQEILHRLGDRMGTPEFVQKMGMNNLNSLYGALHNDMGGTASTIPAAKPYFDQANQISTQNYVIRNRLAKYSPVKNQALEMIPPDIAAKRALGSNSDLQVIRQQIPDAADALAAYELRHLGKRGGTSAPEGEQITPATFGTNLNDKRFRQPEGTQALYGSKTPEASQAVADLSHVAQSTKATTRYANPSGTASHEALWELLKTGLAGAAGGGLTHEALPALAGLIGTPLLGYGLARTVTSPLIARIIGSPSIARRGTAIPAFADPALLKRGSGGLLGVP